MIEFFILKNYISFQIINDYIKWYWFILNNIYNIGYTQKTNTNTNKLMNDDRKFRERAEIMKELFLGRIPVDVITKIAGISEATVVNDRARVTKHFGIKVPSVAVTILDREKRFRLLFSTYLTVEFETHEWRKPLYQAARLLIDFDRITKHISSIETLWEGLQRPRFISHDMKSINYQQLIEDCYSIEKSHFADEFYEYLHSEIGLLETISNEDDVVELFTKFCLNKDRNCLNTLMIDNPKALVDQLFSALTEIQCKVLEDYYGLNGKKKTLDKIGEEHGLTRERIRQIRERSLRIIRNELFEKKYLIHSAAKYEHLEKEHAELNRKFKKYCEETDNEIFLLKSENAKLNGIFEKNDVNLNMSNYPAYFKVLTSPICHNSDIPVRIVNTLTYRYDFILDAIEDWENLIYCRNFGKKTYMDFDEYLRGHGIDRHKLTFQERVFARQLIKRKKEIDT